MSQRAIDSCLDDWQIGSYLSPPQAIIAKSNRRTPFGSSATADSLSADPSAAPKDDSSEDAAHDLVIRLNPQASLYTDL